MPDGRRVMLLGDRHFSNDHGCADNSGVDVEEFIEGVASVAVPNSRVGIYLESGFNPKLASQNIFERTIRLPAKGKGYHISDTVARLEVHGCLNEIPSEVCKMRFPNAMIIPCDKRKFNSYSQLFKAITLIKSRLDEFGIKPESCPDCYKILNSLDDLDNVSKVHKFHRDKAVTNDFLNQLERIENASVKKYISDIYYWKHYTKNYDEVMHDLRKLMTRETKVHHREIKVANDILTKAFEVSIVASLHIMDGYVMARLWNDTAIDRLVVYTGDKHTENYETFLKYIGAKLLVKGEQTSLRCTKIPLSYFTA